MAASDVSAATDPPCPPGDRQQDTSDSEDNEQIRCALDLAAAEDEDESTSPFQTLRQYYSGETHQVKSTLISSIQNHILSMSRRALELILYATMLRAFLLVDE